MARPSSARSWGRRRRRRRRRLSTEGSSGAEGSLQAFWLQVMEETRNFTAKDFFKVPELPVARIRRIMKLDEDVEMISAEAPVLLARAAQIFISELTLRAWKHTEESRQRTLQRTGIVVATTQSDHFDFLIDIVPRDELKPCRRQEKAHWAATPAEPVQYYISLPLLPVVVQGQEQGQQVTTAMTTVQPGQILLAQPQQGQTTPVTMQVGQGQQGQIVQAQPQGQAQEAQSGIGQTVQLMQQIVTNTGEIQQIPVQLDAGQLQYFYLTQPMPGTEVAQDQIQTVAANTQQIAQAEVQQGQQHLIPLTDGQQVQLQSIYFAQPVLSTAVAQGQIQILAANMQQIAQAEVQQGQQQLIPLTDGQQVQLQSICLAHPLSGTEVAQGQIQTLAANTQQIAQAEVQQGQQQLSLLTDGQQVFQMQEETVPASQEVFIESTNQTTDGEAPQVTEEELAQLLGEDLIQLSGQPDSLD